MDILIVGFRKEHQTELTIAQIPTSVVGTTVSGLVSVAEGAIQDMETSGRCTSLTIDLG